MIHVQILYILIFYLVAEKFKRDSNKRFSQKKQLFSKIYRNYF